MYIEMTSSSANSLPKMTPFVDKQFLVLAGGGPKGHILAGAIRQLDTICPNFLSNLKGVAGCSVGALLALLIACRFPSSNILTYTSQFNMTDMMDLKPSALQQYGMDTGEKLRLAIEQILVSAFGRSNISFQELRHKTGIQLVVVATNIDTGEAEYHGLVNSQLPVVTSVLASCSIPLVYIPVNIGGQSYVDGGMVDIFPFRVFGDMHRTLGLRFSALGSGSLTGFKSYLYNVLTISASKLEQLHYLSIPALYRYSNIVTFHTNDNPGLYTEPNVAELTELGAVGITQFIFLYSRLLIYVVGIVVSCRTARLVSERACWTDSRSELGSKLKLE